MNILIFFLPLISGFLWLFILYKWVKKFLNNNFTWYIYFRFLFGFIVLNILYFILIGLVCFYKVDWLSDMSSIWFSIMIWLPILWTSLWIWYVWKYLFNFINFIVFKEDKWYKMYLKMFLLFILSIILLAWMSSWVIYGLIIYFKLIGDISNSQELILSSWLLIWLSWLWVWIWLSWVAAGMFIYIEKLLSKEITNGKRILYIVWSVFFYALLYNLVHFASIVNLIAIFKLIEVDVLMYYNYIFLWIVLWWISLITSVIQWYLFSNYHKNNKNIVLTILSFIISQIVLLFALSLVFKATVG